jgi:hypothetical protein
VGSVLRRIARYALAYDAGIVTGLVLASAYRDYRGSRHNEGDS